MEILVFLLNRVVQVAKNYFIRIPFVELSMSSNKVKGIFKGFRYFTQIFETEKEQDIQIGYPTDVKHVAHIGWDGPSVNSPSWMNEFKSSPGHASTPLDVQNKGQDNVKRIPEDSKRRNTRDLPDLPKASKRQLTGGVTDSPTREKPNRSRQPKRSSNKPKDESNITRIAESTDPFNPSLTLPVPDIPKKSRRQRSKESSSCGSSKSRTKAQPTSDSGSPTQLKSSNIPRSFEENDQDILK
ncbi:hypothetical protein VNO78_21930 [Psophocarpus tetragonolobus]|uniref:CRIB domain-containing protein n=1 Tax=Psophocarpus tetragonolobus TaxID=3891 RepID=A0AAN9SCF2_PSOTE